MTVSRTYDIQAWPSQTEGNVLADAFHTGFVITGIYKLAQRFLIVLLTEKGSYLYEMGRAQVYGTGFLTQIRKRDPS
jgi:hypothetical protein